MRWQQQQRCLARSVALAPFRDERAMAEKEYIPRQQRMKRHKWLSQEAILAIPQARLCIVLLFQARPSAEKMCWYPTNPHVPLWRSPPGIACESILPRHSMMRTNSPIRSRWRRASFSGLGQGKHFHILLAPVGHPGAAKRSTCHIFPTNGSVEPDPLLDRGTDVRQVAKPMDKTNPVGWCSFSQTL
jgi:hypothetical protein